MKKAKKYDSAWKNAMSRFLPKLILFINLELWEKVDWFHGYESLDKELMEFSRHQKIGKRVTDALFKLWLKEGQEIFLLLHLEVQSQKDSYMPERMFVYRYRIFDRYKKPTVSLVILADDNPNWRPGHYEDHHFGNVLRFEFSTFKLLDYADKKDWLKEQSNPFCIMVWAHLEELATKKDPEKRFNAKMAVTRVLYERGYSKDDIIELFAFIDWLLALPEPMELEYNGRIKQLEEEKKMRYVTSIERQGEQRGIRIGKEEGMQIGKKEGMQIGKKEGIQIGERLLLKEILVDRFESLPSHFEEQLELATSEQLLRLSKRLFHVKTLEALFKDWM